MALKKQVKCQASITLSLDISVSRFVMVMVSVVGQASFRKDDKCEVEIIFG